jgi:hypothetical protein
LAQCITRVGTEIVGRMERTSISKVALLDLGHHLRRAGTALELGEEPGGLR